LQKYTSFLSLKIIQMFKCRHQNEMQIFAIITKNFANVSV
jgi:hypothetical protein